MNSRFRTFLQLSQRLSRDNFNVWIFRLIVKVPVCLLVSWITPTDDTNDTILVEQKRNYMRRQWATRLSMPVAAVSELAQRRSSPISHCSSLLMKTKRRPHPPQHRIHFIRGKISWRLLRICYRNVHNSDLNTAYCAKLFSSQLKRCISSWLFFINNHSLECVQIVRMCSDCSNSHSFWKIIIFECWIASENEHTACHRWNAMIRMHTNTHKAHLSIHFLFWIFIALWRYIVKLLSSKLFIYKWTFFVKYILQH